ncbi:MAG TPA: methyltransferase domain-containing protein [Aliidongia sp.]|uniref:class I SAM-dependent methyltransferase n=1 Tax=Aliidongia sp. TaxID=1914230 RepID=UPI002DDCC254|nr:methyltransferase domain-containing protein [Aliidongia sp.]HEV2675059.1 methyltransferase domain-containing protein [Aliidongia sp.]
MTQAPKNLGDFTGLAGDYSRYRPGYAPSVLTSILALVKPPVAEADIADVGAGTGIWTRMLAEREPRSVVAVEPNDDMREQGILASKGTSISWRKGNGEATGLPDASVDLVSMASSFHWVDYDKGCAEFQRILRPGGRFVAVWNPRLIEVNPLLVEIEAEIGRLKPDIKRVSSGRSGLTDRLNDKLWATPGFDDVVYLEGRHVSHQTPEQYIGAWRSVNDLQVQLGTDLFAAFIRYIEGKTAGLATIETTYLTRAWTARRV